MAKHQKYDLPVITAEQFNLYPERYELRKGSHSDAPDCPYGNRFEWIGFDKETNKYVRVTKSVFKKLIHNMDNDFVRTNDEFFEEIKEIDNE